VIGNTGSLDALYARPGSARVNRYLPHAPFLLRKLDAPPCLSRLEQFSLGMLGAVAAALAVTAVYLASHLTLWTLKAGILFPFFAPEEVDLLLRKGWGFISAVLVMVGVLLLFGTIAWSRRRLQAARTTQRRFITGAEEWSGVERLRALVVYSIASPWCVVAPLLVVPLRFLHGAIAMAVYLVAVRRIYALTAEAMAAFYADATVRVLVFLAGAAALYVALTVTVPSI